LPGSSADIDREVRKVAELLRLTPYLDRLPLSLSGGQQQRTALARAIVKNASLVLLDEPLANLDYKLREELREELPKIFAGLRRDLRLCHDRAVRGAAARRQHRHAARGPRQPVRPDGRRFIRRNPRDLVTARTFSDPPLNTIRP
jgi:glycerol transport system ATP-binding protein